MFKGLPYSLLSVLVNASF